MQKARYSTHNIGHYGLAFDYYTHFTSPIRRFPDMMVHRLVTKYLDGGRSVSESKYEDLCDHSSNMEQIAANAERASIKYKQVEFMSERVGQTYDGVISGVTEWGLYVELNENKCEGMIPMRDLDDDYYEFLKQGKVTVDGVTVLDAAYLIPFKAKAWMDLTDRKALGEHVDSKNIKKHKNDVFRLTELIDPTVKIAAPSGVYEDMQRFVERMKDEAVDIKQLGLVGRTKEQILREVGELYILP